ncbi:hypothetical protein EA462_15510 [Natrarchaeobius halalkaliphilus]|uniref:DUF8106 domain-containing protein n=1 Tax=Natrarchaeobius halalkaliphilus TaxID=1679091 RepID=A0A3N6LNF3_9EURY|nr:hypothetical protein EA462_15510 [Natrarchaeobius halalkaliphilus]
MRPTFERSPTRKATLYCFNCGHKSILSGDWIVRTHGECIDYECPECRTRIATRPTRTDSVADSNGGLCYSPGD